MYLYSPSSRPTSHLRCGQLEVRGMSSHASTQHTDGGEGLLHRPFKPHWLVKPAVWNVNSRLLTGCSRRMWTESTESRDRPIAVVRRRPDSQNSLVEVPLVAFHHELMCSADQVDAVGCVELLYHITAEQVAGSSRGHAPTLCVYNTLLSLR